MSAPQSDTEKLGDERSSGQTMSAPQSDVEKPAPESMPWHPSQYPDGGLQAWLVVAGAFCCVFCSFGWINCMFDFPVFHPTTHTLTDNIGIGVFQSYYQTHQLKQYSASDISWIASLELFIMFSGVCIE
jgi:hypothetical protein